MFCQNCGTFDSDDAKFCRQCGESLLETPTARSFVAFRIPRKGTLLETRSSLWRLFNLSFEHSAFKRLEFVYRLALLTAAASAIASMVIGFKNSHWMGLFTLLFIVPLMFVSVTAFSRVILELFLIAARLPDHADRGAEKGRPGEEIEWNIGAKAEK